MKTIRPTTLRPAAALAALLALCLAPSATLADDDELLELMTALQTYAHKLQLSLEASNADLAGFYLHEIEELLEEVEEIEEYDGYPVGQLAPSMLAPAMNALEATLEEDVDAAAGQPFDALVNACNACHTATEHGFIVIARNSDNPYLQSFEP